SILLFKARLQFDSSETVEWLAVRRRGWVRRCQTVDDFALEDFSSRGSREIRIGPDAPTPDLLEFGDLQVGGRNGVGRINTRPQDQYGMRLRSMRASGFHNRGVLDTFLCPQGGLQVLGINIQSGRGDDDIFLAPAKTQIALVVKFGEVS